MREIDRIIVHHSAGPKTESMEAIRRYHIEERAYTDIAYHVVLERGRVRLGRPWWLIGAHDMGENTTSIGICVVGDYRPGHDEFGEWRWGQLVTLCADFCEWFDLPAAKVYGHRENEPPETPTECPGFDPQKLRDAVFAELMRREEL